MDEKEMRQVMPLSLWESIATAAGAGGVIVALTGSLVVRRPEIILLGVMATSIFLFIAFMTRLRPYQSWSTPFASFTAEEQRRQVVGFRTLMALIAAELVWFFTALIFAGGGVRSNDNSIAMVCVIGGFNVALLGTLALGLYRLRPRT